MENYIIKAEELEQIKGLLPAIVYNELSKYTEQSQEIAEEIVEEVIHEKAPAVIEAIAETLADFTADDYHSAIETYNAILEYAEGEEKEQAQEALELAEMMLESLAEKMEHGGSVGGRGWGNFKKGKKIKNVLDLQVGKIYLDHNKQFNSENIILITSGDTTGLKRDIVYASFVRPNNLKGKEENFAIWGHDLDDTVEIFEIKNPNAVSPELGGGDVESSKFSYLSALDAFDLSELDPYETQQYNHFIKSMSKVEVLEILINTVEGDNSQLSEGLAEIAKKYKINEDIEYGIGGFLKSAKDKTSALYKKAHEGAGAAYEKAKPHISKASEKAKETYAKGKKAVKDKIHDEKKKIALQVIDETKDNVGSSQKVHLKAAEELIEYSFKDGGVVCPEGTKLQSLVFTKDKFTKLKARAWAKKHDYKFAGVDVTKTQYRLRQEAPSKFKKESFRTINITDGIQGIVACLVN